MKTSLLSGYFNILKKININQMVFLFFIGGVSFLLSILYLNINYYQDKIYPQTYIDDTDVSGLTIIEAVEKLNNDSPSIEPHQLEIFVDDIKVASSSTELGVYKNYLKAVDLAYGNNKSESKLQTVVNFIKSYFNKSNFESKIWYQEEKLDRLVSLLSENVLIEGKFPEVSLEISGNKNSINVFEGSPGRTINATKTKESVEKQTNEGEFEIRATVASTSAVLTKEQVEMETSRAEKFVGKSLEAKAENKRYELTDKELVSLIEPLKKYKTKEIEKLIEKWSEGVNRAAQDAKFEYNKDTLEVEAFEPHKDGLEINKPATNKEIASWLENAESSIDDENDETEAETSEENQILEIPLKRTGPSTTLESTNDLGIKERIGFGESYYHHSIINRIHNVGITAERISLTIVPPGEEFSFNKALGEVSSRTGFRSAYVISGGKTVLGDGGGVCQVSSTLFRSVLDAGLKVTKRLQHSYRVSYYELNSDPGFDATVYSGNIDFRFINDTDHHILIYSYVESDNRYMNIEIYGASDGRTTEVSNYKKWDFRRPPAPEYFPTTDLPSGVVKQVDWSVSGIKTEFTHTIKDKNGEIISENVYYSNYRPWSAKFMKGI